MNDPSWRATFDAHAVVGAAALASREATGLVLLAPPPQAASSDDPGPIVVTGTLQLMVYGTGETRKIELKRLTLAPAGLEGK